MDTPHITVLLAPFLEFFKGRDVRLFIDATLGAGGHSEAMLREHPEIETLVGIDQDPLALEIAKKRLHSWEGKLKFIQGNFADHLSQEGIAQADGMILDLGVSSMQLDMPEKGFSFMRDGPLDMRMDPTADLTAADVVNTWSEQQLGIIFRDYGEEKQWRSAARAIVQAREHGPITTTLQLGDVLLPVLGWKRKEGINPLTLVFQALRICVNDELGVLEKVLPLAVKSLKKGGRLGVISFHSLEDRIVKNYFRFLASDKHDTSGIGGMFLDKEPEAILLTRKPVIADDNEIRDNPRSRSAKLRMIEKL